MIETFLLSRTRGIETPKSLNYPGRPDIVLLRSPSPSLNVQGVECSKKEISSSIYKKVNSYR